MIGLRLGGEGMSKPSPERVLHVTSQLLGLDARKSLDKVVKTWVGLGYHHYKLVFSLCVHSSGGLAILYMGLL